MVSHPDKKESSSSSGDVCAVIVAAGQGRRMDGRIPKQFLPIAGKPVLAHTIAVFCASPSVDRIVVVAGPDQLERCKKSVLPQAGCTKPLALVRGGACRGDSVFAGLAAAGPGTGIVVVHDGVRPLVRPDQIARVVSVAAKTGACILAVPAHDTLKRVEEGDRISETLDRSRIWMAQTPQAFRYDLLWDAHRAAREERISATDDAQLLERMRLPVSVVEGDRFNLKITTAQDLQIVEAVLTAGAHRS